MVGIVSFFHALFLSSTPSPLKSDEVKVVYLQFLQAGEGQSEWQVESNRAAWPTGWRGGSGGFSMTAWENEQWQGMRLQKISSPSSRRGIFWTNVIQPSRGWVHWILFNLEHWRRAFVYRKPCWKVDTVLGNINFLEIKCWASFPN